MDIQFFGANCVMFTVQGMRVVVDDNLAVLGGKSVTRAGDVALFTGVHGDSDGPRLVIDSPGEFEVSTLAIYGISARAHIDQIGKQSVTMYRLEAGDLSVLITGHIYPELNDAQLEQISTVDVVIIPVGGNGYTLDPVGALTVIKELEPKLVIPTHYADKTLQYPVPQQSLEDAIKGLAMEPAQTTGKLKLKSGDLTSNTQLIIVEKQ